MNEHDAKIIFWAFQCNDSIIPLLDFEKSNEYYDHIMKELNKIADRYSILKVQHSFSEAYRMSLIEWLVNYEFSEE